MHLSPEMLAALAGAFFVAAALYSSVGHGGASAFLAIMALFSLPALSARPVALMLNLLVAGIGAVRFIRAGRIDWRLAGPLAIGAAPFAFLGAAIKLPEALYRFLLAMALVLAALRLLVPERPETERPLRPPPAVLGLGAGAGIGLLAGLTGTGGGIFLSPLIIFLRWTATQKTAGVASLFILVNSTAGLLGHLASFRALPSFMPVLLAAAGAGALLGTWLGVARYTKTGLRRALALVLLAAGAKLAFA